MASMIEKLIDNYLFKIYEDNSKLSHAIAINIINQVSEKLKIKERFQLCLCGGSTPKKVYELLSESDLPWDRVDIFLGDERCVSPRSEDSNALMIKNSLLKNFGASANFYQFFENEIFDQSIVKASITKMLLEKCNGFPPTFDFTLLGLGDDGHTASLFPFKKHNSADEILIFTEGKGLKRISLTPKVFNSSKEIVFLVSGSSKQIALKRLINKNESSERTPAKLIRSKLGISVFCDMNSYKELSI